MERFHWNGNTIGFFPKIYKLEYFARTGNFWHALNDDQQILHYSQLSLKQTTLSLLESQVK